MILRKNINRAPCLFNRTVSSAIRNRGIKRQVYPDGISRIAKTAWQVNEKTENIGARRLHTILERLLESASFEASDLNGQKITIDQDYVDQQLQALAADEDLSRFIL